MKDDEFLDEIGVDSKTDYKEAVMIVSTFMGLCSLLYLFIYLFIYSLS